MDCNLWMVEPGVVISQETWVLRDKRSGNNLGHDGVFKYVLNYSCNIPVKF